MNGKIYKITNLVNGKIYIGQTVQSLEERFYKHCAKYSDKLHFVMPIKQAIFKYGKENFKMELIEECDIELLNEREQYWIAYYDSYNNGYNCTLGGYSGLHRCKLSNEEELDVCSRYKDGYTMKSLASLYEIDRTTVYNILSRNNVDIVDVTLLKNRFDLNEFIEFIKTYPVVSDVTDKFKISSGSVYKLLKQLDDPSLKLNPYNPRKPKTVNDIDSTELISLYNDGWSILDLVKKYQIRKGSISKFLKESGVNIRRGVRGYLHRI